MTTPTIHVHTMSDKSTVRYARFMWETALAMATRPDLLRLTVHCMGPTAVDSLRDLPQSTVTQVTGYAEELHGSYGHGASIMAALKMMTDSSIHVIADSDTVIVAKGWDDYLRQRIAAQGIGMMGTTYEDLGGFSSGNDRIQTYKKVPTFTWVAMNPRHGWPALNVMPNKNHIVKISDENLSKIYGLPVGYSVFGEAGWQVPQFVADNSIPYDGWRQLKPTKEAVVLKGLSDYHEEYHADGVPFVVHHRGSMKHSYRGDKISSAFYAAVDKYLADERDRSPRWTWQHDTEFTFIESPRQSEAVTSTGEVIPPATTFLTPVPATSHEAEWVKVSHDGAVIRPRSPFSRVADSGSIIVNFNTDLPLGHVRIEGQLAENARLIVPSRPKPYSITCRNATAKTVFVSTPRGPNSVEVLSNKTMIVLVDVDGAFRIGD